MKNKKKKKRNMMFIIFFTTFLQQIFKNKLLQAISDGQKIISVVNSN